MKKILFTYSIYAGLILCAAIYYIGLNGCHSNRIITKEKSAEGQNIPPGQSRISARIIKIDTTYSCNSPDDPCSKAPCIAWVKIENIIGYGTGGSALNAGDTLKTKFAFTLGKTDKETFTALKENLPGLEEDSRFEANIQLLPSMPPDTKKEKMYLVYVYKKIN